jgi:uncharacterized protein YbjT (DUF2867 family)
MTRKPDSPAAQALKSLGAEVVRGDLDDAASVRAALRDVWGVYGVQNTWEAGVEKEEEQGKRLAQVAREAGVQHYVYASVASAHRRTGIPHFDNKSRIEDTVRGLGFPSWTIVRPVFFMENLLGPWFKPGIAQGMLAMALKPATVLQMIAVRDVGAYGALAFARQAELNGKALDIAGDALTMPATAAILSRAAGRTVTHVQVPIEEVRKGSADFAIMLEWFDAVGYDADIAGNAKTFGIAPTRFADWAAQQSW